MLELHQIWLVVSTPLKNISQLGSLFPIYGKIKAMFQTFQTTNQMMYPPYGCWSYTNLANELGPHPVGTSPAPA